MTREEIQIIHSAADILNAVVEQLRANRHHHGRDEYAIESALKEAISKLHIVISSAQSKVESEISP
ncbi:MAG: hypothetical protein MZU84_03185 [Sphingobacterium sp.]|nr:hypothetical protein [Sphingobacterium sp.]